MMDCSYSTGESLLGGSKVEEGCIMWEPEMVLFGNVDVATFNHDSAPISHGDLSSTSDLEHGFLVDNNDWMSSGVDILSHYVDNDFSVCSLLQQQSGPENASVYSPSAFHSDLKTMPASPANSYDSGVGSPYSDSSSILLDATPRSSNVVPVLEHRLEESNSFPFPLHNASDALTETSVKGELLEQIEIRLVPSFQPEVALQASQPTFAQLTADDVRAFIDASSGSDSDGMSEGSLSPASSRSTSLPSDVSPVAIPATTSPKSRCGRKRKVTSLEEKKQRKRDQNKNAATRYRERKRQEGQEREAEFDALNTKNKDLKNKISQISKEMDYLKELMIEVYTLKGLIS